MWSDMANGNQRHLHTGVRTYGQCPSSAPGPVSPHVWLSAREARAAAGQVQRYPPLRHLSRCSCQQSGTPSCSCLRLIPSGSLPRTTASTMSGANEVSRSILPTQLRSVLG